MRTALDSVPVEWIEPRPERKPGSSRRAAPRAPLACPVTLWRTTGAPVTGSSVDVSRTGARLRVGRPLAIDETVRFELTLGARAVDGYARVLRQDQHDTYALRFEGLGGPAADELERAVAAAVPVS